MITEYIRYRIPDGDAAEFESDYARAARQLTGASQCHDYELSRCEEDPACYVLRITWTSTEDHLHGFRGSERFPAFFAAISPYVDRIEEMRHYRPTAVVGRGAAVPTLYEWAGGAEAFAELTRVFYAKVPDDELLAPVFAAMPSDHQVRVAQWLGEVFGGPRAYSEQRATAARGGHATMINQHRGRRLTEPQRRRWVDVLLQTDDEIGMPADPEFRGSFVGYLEWGSRMAVQLSAPGVGEPDPHAAMPSWDWALPPWRSEVTAPVDGTGRR
ncbi:group II truncated hemoglobin [Microlunatus soli]|uniref:Truncated hemoglobin YjbI n=1 Tax=Microlunatus soli TaxID=630515 RepID=A0A1H1Y2Z0_9ACTN|nr:antibiotic biosynthesis monooxygenase [Microlunatus soli]SDT15790.1 Truncated hemoglobin YjbI [Microlunatus soli]